MTFAEGQGEQTKFDELLGYKNVVVTKVEPDGIRIRHESGMKKLKIEDLPKEIREKFGLNEGAAREYREAALNQEKEAAKAEQASYEQQAALQRAEFLKYTVRGKIQQITPLGVLLRETSAFRITEQQIPYEVKVDGPTAFEPNRKVKTETRYKLGKAPAYKEKLSRLVFVKCDVSKYKDSSKPDLEIEAYEMGDFIYRNSRVDTFSINAADAGKNMEIKID